MRDVLNTEMSDLYLIFRLFDHSITYQEKKGYPVWKNYDKNAIVKDIQNKNQYKILIDSLPAIVFSVCYTDKSLWRDRDRQDAIYLHRIVVNPDCKGRQLFGKILEWAITHARQKELRYIRMDTWAANPTLINYYEKFGFNFIENFTTPDSEELPVHNRNLALALLELEYKL
jgi:ribosomal protein S18 acetylase RimI-like enzyme